MLRGFLLVWAAGNGLCCLSECLYLLGDGWCSGFFVCWGFGVA